MESAHLTKAHEHVRNAATATHGNSIATAGHEHDSAASAFRDAAKDTHNAEAMRILNLLEDHHHRLAGLIKEAPRRKLKEKEQKKTEVAGQATDTSATSAPPTKASVPRAASPRTSASSPTRAPSRRRLPQSSIASNLAEARGIGPRRATPSNAAISTTNAIAGRNKQAATPVRDMLSRKAEAHKRTESPRASRHEEKDTPAGQTLASSSTEDNFRRFYSAFGGVISAISAPLAFTSLPLRPTPPTPAPEPPPTKDSKPLKAKSRTHSPEASRTVKSSEPDLAALISKPALRALREDGSAPVGPFANNESFYLVPTSGGTVSYASILQNPNAPHHPHHAARDPHLDSIDEADTEPSSLKGSSHEEFVDAHETVNPPSPTLSRRPHSRGKCTSTTTTVTALRSIPAGRGSGLKTMEELSLENETLKTLVDKQSKRLSMWETTSQSSYNALAQSFRARKMPSDPSAMAHALALGSTTAAAAGPVSPGLNSPTAAPTATQQQQQQPDPTLVKRIADLEEQLAARTAQITTLTTDNEQLVRQNKRNTEVLGRYREQWEKLKAGARKRDQERKAKTNPAKTTTGVEGQSQSGEAEAEAEAEAGKESGEEDVVESEEPGFGKA